MEEHTDDCRIYDDASCCDCGYIKDTLWPRFKGHLAEDSTEPEVQQLERRRA